MQCKYTFDAVGIEGLSVLVSSASGERESCWLTALRLDYTDLRNQNTLCGLMSRFAKNKVQVLPLTRETRKGGEERQVRLGSGFHTHTIDF
jgi:hypothetical protein